MGLFDTLAMVALWVREAEKALLEKSADCVRIRCIADSPGISDVLLLVPKGKADILDVMGVADASDAVLAPTVCPGASVLMRKVFWSNECQHNEVFGADWLGQGVSRLQASPSGL